MWTSKFTCSLQCKTAAPVHGGLVYLIHVHPKKLYNYFHSFLQQQTGMYYTVISYIKGHFKPITRQILAPLQHIYLNQCYDSNPTHKISKEHISINWKTLDLPGRKSQIIVATDKIIILFCQVLHDSCKKWQKTL